MKCERGMSCRMDMRRWLAWGAVTVLLAVWSLPAGAVGDLVEELPPELVEHIRANRPPELDQEEVMNAFYQYLYPYDLEEEPDTWREIEHVGQIEQPGAPRSRTSVEEALADVDILFDLLKYGYSGYQMFGGDEAFGEAKKALKEDLAQESEPLSAQTLGSRIREHLDFVQDGHFAVDGKTTLVRSTYLTTLDYEVRPVDEELVLYKVAGEEKRLGTLLTINHQDPQAYLKPSLNEEAEFVYRLGTQKEEPLERIELVVESVDGQTELEVPLRPGDPDYTRQPGPLYTLDEETGIPVAACRALFAFEDAGPYSAFSEEDIDTFLDDAAALGEEPCLILDLRSNRGGMTGYAY